MHESGLAEAIVAELRRQAWSSARVLVSDPWGTHTGEALRLHLAIAGPDLDLSAVEVVAVPVGAHCVGCGRAVTVVDANAPCPDCGQPVLPAASVATVEIEIVEAERLGPDHERDQPLALP